MTNAAHFPLLSLILFLPLAGAAVLLFIPKENEKDLAEIPDNVKRHLKLVPVADVDEVDRIRGQAARPLDELGQRPRGRLRSEQAGRLRVADVAAGSAADREGRSGRRSHVAGTA